MIQIEFCKRKYSQWNTNIFNEINTYLTNIWGKTEINGMARSQEEMGSNGQKSKYILERQCGYRFACLFFLSDTGIKVKDEYF